MSKYKAGDKVILTVTSTNEMGCLPCYVLNDDLILSKQDIDKYTEPLAAYTEQARAEGQNEAWELARKIVSDIYHGGYNSDELKEIFGYFLYQNIWEDNTYPKAAAKVTEWEKAKEEIKVGDIYRSNVGNYFVIRTTDREEGVTKILFISSGEVTPDYIKSHCTKTGRHIDIDGFLKQIGGGDDEK